MYSNIYILRHGQTTWNAEKRMQGKSNDIPLSDIGKEQMNTIGKYLQENTNKNFIIVSSPMLRAQQSLKIINSYLNIPEHNIFTLPDLHEMNFGDFEGKTKQEVKNHKFFTQRIEKKWDTPYPNGESYNDVYIRIKNSELKNIYKKTQRKKMHLLCIAHESINRIIPQVLTPEIEENNIAVNNRQANNEIVVIKNNTRNKLKNF